MEEEGKKGKKVSVRGRVLRSRRGPGLEGQAWVPRAGLRVCWCGLGRSGWEVWGREV